MTPGGTSDWDDERLAAAFGALRVGRPTPPDLVTVAVEQVRNARVDQPAQARRASLALLASAAAVAVLVGVVAVARPPGPVAAPTAAFGLPILSVAEAITVRDTDPTDREIAVRGWFSPPPQTPCGGPMSPAENPVRLECPHNLQWLLDGPLPLPTSRGTLPVGRIGFQPLLPFLEDAPLASAGQRAAAAGSLPELVLIGHFHDRRGVPALCDVPDPAACAGFVVDSIFSIDGRLVPSSTVVDLEPLAGEPRREPSWTTADVDRLVLAALPQFRILSRVALPGDRIGELEPALGTGALGIIDRPIAWVVTGLDPGPNGLEPARRTLLIVDGTGEAYEAVPWEVSNIGFVPFALVPLPPEPSRIVASMDPMIDPFAGAPTSVFGIGVGSIATAKELHPQRDAAEIAVRGWYVPPDPAATCPLMRDPIRPVGPPCPQGRHWLLDEEQQLWSDPIKVDIDRQPTGAYLNPIVPYDVTIDVPSGWEDGSAEPWPVVLLGHFADPRARTQGGQQEFTVDALVWRRGDPPFAGDPPQNTVAFQTATESEDVVRRRLDERLGPAYATWLTVVSGVQLQIVDPDIEPGRTDLAEAPVVWVARRLVDERDGNVLRRVITTAMTVDGSNRIWARRNGRTLELETPLIVPRGPSDPSLLVEDQLGQIESATFDVPPLLTWRPIGPPEASSKAVAATGDPRQLAVRWRPNICGVAERLIVTANLWIGFHWALTDEAPCPTGREDAVVLLTFDRPIDVDVVKTDDVSSGG